MGGEYVRSAADALDQRIPERLPVRMAGNLGHCIKRSTLGAAGAAVSSGRRLGLRALACASDRKRIRGGPIDETDGSGRARAPKGSPAFGEKTANGKKLARLGSSTHGSATQSNRHHGPGSAASLVAHWIDSILRPADRGRSDSMFCRDAASRDVRPVALLIHAVDEPSLASFFPFAVFFPNGGRSFGRSSAPDPSVHRLARRECACGPTRTRERAIRGAFRGHGRAGRAQRGPA